MTKRVGQPTDFESFLTWEALTDVLSYDPGTGEFRWVKSGRLGWVGRRAGYIDQAEGYRRIEILGRPFYASRLAHLYMTKRWPKNVIDHKNGIRDDDRWANLREASRQQNSFNRKPSKNSKSGINGVYGTADGEWIARCKIGETRFNLGVFETIEQARRARENFEVANFAGYHPGADDPGPVVPRDDAAILPTTKRQARRGIPSDFESVLTQEIVTRLLSYDPVSGLFVWRSNETNPRRIKVEQPAGQVNSSGYVLIQIMGRKFVAHRLAWLYMTGRWPTALVDHINQDKADNRWENLRPASHSDNGYNRYRVTSRSSAGRHIYRRENGKYRVMVGKDGKNVNLGNFDTIGEAEAARDEFYRQQANEFLSNTAKIRGVP